MEKPLITIPENVEITPSDVKKEADSKFKDINYILLSVVIILLVMVATLIIDSFHINSATYKEYSQKTEAVGISQEVNETLLKQIQELSEQHKQNQEIIIRKLNEMIEVSRNKK